MKNLPTLREIKFCQKNFKTYASKTTTVVDSLSRIRNIGIIAHIDAGKTTVTEQLLYLTGTTSTVGSVDSGNTITDFMDIERERGITIQSAAISSFWRDHKINLIDTPGHVDFTVEVERCLRVLDGAVTVLDGSAGVQAQTLTVWKQANKNKLPSIFFVNKMDKPGADFYFTLSTVKDRLNMRTAPIVLPLVGQQNCLEAFVNVLNRRYLPFNRSFRLDRTDDSSEANSNWLKIPKNSRAEDIYLLAKEDLCLTLADSDKQFEDQFTAAPSLSEIPVGEIIKALRRSTLERTLSPVACGSALHSSASVQPILDMILDFLPSPEERDYHIGDAVQTCAFVFKVSHDKNKGQLNYVRMFRGAIDSSTVDTAFLINANTGEHQRNYQAYTAFGDSLQPISSIAEGNIAVLTGLKNTKTGDTLISCDNVPRHFRRDHSGIDERSSSAIKKLALEGIDAPQPVFSCTIEPPNLASEKEFHRALSELQVEDPSLLITEDPNTGQKILHGMGELQIEVVKERLLREYRLNVFLGPLKIGYLEVPTASAEYSDRIEESSQGQQRSSCSIRLRVEPGIDGDEEGFGGVRLAIESEDHEEAERAVRFLTSRDEWLRAINDGCLVALHNGPALNLPVTNVRVLLKSFTFHGKVRPTLLSACASRCLTGALSRANVSVLEPLMVLEVTLVAGNSGISNPDPIVRELSQRRASILNVDSQEKIAIIQALIPIAETRGMAKALRRISGGLASMSMASKGYQSVSEENVHSDF